MLRTTTGDALELKDSLENDCKGSDGEMELADDGAVCVSSGISRESPIVRFAGLIGGKEAEVGENASSAVRFAPDRGGVG